ncbi:hypothetical protein ES707_19508 [subsurface metagenome]
MRLEESSKAKPRKKSVKRILTLLLSLIVVLIVLVLFLIPAFISSGKGRQVILARINNSIAGQTDFANLSMSWFKGIKIVDFSFNDSSGQTCVQVKQITTKPHYFSILTGNLSFGQTIIDKPRIQINLKGRQLKKSGGFQQEPSTGQKTQPVILPVKKIDLVVNDGNLKVTDSKTETIEFSRINSTLNLRPLGQQTNFQLNMEVAQADKASNIKLVSRINPGRAKTGWSLKGTSGDLTVEVNDLDFESLGPIFALAGLDVQTKGLLFANVNGKIKDGYFDNLNADVKVKNLDITGAELKGDRLQTSALDVSVKLNHNKKTINIDNLRLKSDWAFVQVSGVVPTTFESLADFLEADSKYNLKGDFYCNLATLFSQMPKTSGLKEGVQITSGQLSGNIESSTKAGQKQIQGKATLAGLEGTVEGKKIALSEPLNTEAKISSDKTGINFDKLDLSASFAKINASGTLEQLKYNGYVDLEKLQSELGQFANLGAYKIAGELSEQGILSVVKNKITGAGSAQVKNLSITSTDGVTAQEPMAEVKFAFAMDRQSNVLTFNSMESNSSLGQVNIEQAILPIGEKPQVPMHLAISANNIDLEKLQPFAVLFASLPQETQLAGIAESKISVSTEKNIYKIITDSTKIKDLKLIYPGRKPFEPNEVTLTFNAEVNPKQKTVNIKELQLESPQIKIHKGEFNLLNEADKTKLKGQAECEYDWSAVSAVAAPYLPEGLTLQGKRKDAVSFVSEYPRGQTDKLLANLTANAKLGFERAGYMGLNFGPTDVDINIQKGLLKIAPFVTTVNEGQFTFAGQTDFRQKPAQFKIAKPMQIMKDIKINDQTTKKLLKYLNPVFADAVNVSGIANFSCEQLTIPLSAAAKNQIEVVGTISMDQVRLQASDLLGQILSGGTSARGTDITIRPTKFILRDGFLRYDDMQMDIGDNPVNFKGVIGLDKSLDMTITLPYTAMGRTVRLGRETSGQRITLPLKGTVDKPQLDIGKLLEGQLRQQLEDQLRKGLEDLFK